MSVQVYCICIFQAMEATASIMVMEMTGMDGFTVRHFKMNIYIHVLNCSCYAPITIFVNNLCLLFYSTKSTLYHVFFLLC